jgi:class 3 adenylate cyclase/CheY-like chemotaxis protein
MKNFSSKEIRFSGDSIKSCVGFIDLVDSTKNTITMESLDYIRKYYSTFINSISKIVKSYSGKVIKNIGDCLLFYFPKTTDVNNIGVFIEAIECGFKILDERYSINQELLKQQLPPFNYRISLDYGVLDLALVGDYSQIDLFGTTINLCSKINSASSVSNEIIIGDNFYRILKSFSTMLNSYNFINHVNYQISESNRYSLYNIKRKNTVELELNNIEDDDKHSFDEQQLGSSTTEIKKNTNNNKRIILVDDEEDVLFTYKTFLEEEHDYDVIAFTDPSLAMNYIRNISNFRDLLLILDIRMKNLNGFQFHQQIKAIDPTIKILFVTALDILDEFSTIIPGISKEYIMKKPVDRKIFTNTIQKILK